jgi:glycosyltransferase involved in cell wall biosynthesis
MRVLTVLPCRFWGGPEKQTLQLASWLRKNRNVETIFAVMAPDGDGIEKNPLMIRARDAGFVAELFAPGHRYDPIAGVRGMRRLVGRYRPDVVCSTGYKADLLTSCLRGVPTVTTLRGFTAQNAKVRFFEWLDLKSLRFHDSIIVVSNALRDRAIRNGAAPAKLFWVPNAIDMTLLPPRRERDEWCREIGADPARPILGVVGRLSPEKGHSILLSALASLTRSLPEVQLVVVGDGPEETALRRQTAALGLSDSVIFTGLRPDGQQIIGALDVLALPSFTEGMPNVLLEAFAYGTPVVATSVGAVPDMIERGRSGWTVTPGDTTALSEALREALLNRPEAARRALEAQAILAERFTIEKQGMSWLRAIDSAMQPTS